MDNTTEYAPLWVSEPDTRGTWGILYSCVFTLSLCVWSAIHLNIPPHGEADYVQYRRKTKWVFVAIFAPELVLYSAWQQFYLARRFCNELQHIRREQAGYPQITKQIWLDKLLDFFFEEKSSDTKDSQSDDSRAHPTTSNQNLPTDHSKVPLNGAEPSSDAEKVTSGASGPPLNVKSKEQRLEPPEIEEISLVYGFYVVMGGFIVNVSDMYDNKKVAWQTITPRGVIELAKSLPQDQFQEQFRISEDTIRDKSKADCLAKVLVFFQVLWALLQCISRVVQGYPTSVLEIHTLVHAGCAMMMYGLWFKKPLDIRDSTEVNASTFKDKLALMLVRNPGSAFKPYTKFKMPKTYNRPRPEELPFGWPILDAEAAFMNFNASDSDGTTLHNPQNREKDSQEVKPMPQQDTPEASENEDHNTRPSESTADRVADQMDLEARVGISLRPLRELTAISEPALIYRTPPLDVQIVETLSTGEMLSSGIGPTALITSKVRSRKPLKGQPWYSEDRLRSTLAPAIPQRTRVMKRLADAVRLPEYPGDPVEVDDRLKPLIPLPLKLKRWKPQDALYHKMLFSLSEKDKFRWECSGRGFRAELSQRRRPANKHQSGQARTAVDRGQGSAIDKVSDADADHDVSLPNPSPKDSPKLLSLQKQNTGGAAAPFTKMTFCDRSRNLDTDSFNVLMSMTGRRSAVVLSSVWIVMGCISELYAGIHLALWNHNFPTEVERLLWRISGCVLAAPAISIGLFVTVVLSIGLPLEWFEKRKTFAKQIAWLRAKLQWMKVVYKKQVAWVKSKFQWMKLLYKWLKSKYHAHVRVKSVCHTLGKIITWMGLAVLYAGFAVGVAVFYGVIFGGLLLYCFARVYIVVESFLSLRHVPAGVYQEVSWAQYIPHL